MWLSEKVIIPSVHRTVSGLRESPEISEIATINEEERLAWEF